jgi:SAM-dependent methyltransferase
MISALTRRDNARFLTRIDPKEISEGWRSSLSIDVGDAFRSLQAIDYWECPTTGFRWYTPQEAAGGGDLYAQLDNRDWYYMADKWEFSSTLSLIPRNSSILEVGVGEGHFLRFARGYGHALQGVELNPKGAERARASSFEVHEVTLQHLRATTSERFDVVCSFQVLEHVPDPRDFLDGMIGLLKPGGKLILSVPNAAVMRKIDPHNQDLLNQPPHHMGHWDETVFRSIEKFLPLTVKSVRREPLAKYHVRWMVNGYLRSLLSPIGNMASRVLVNRYSTAPVQMLLQLGFRRLLPGHTLLVELEYQPE